MLGREPRLSHAVMRWLIIGLMIINGLQLILLQTTINASISRDYGQVWLCVGLSFAALLGSAILIAYGFWVGRSGRKRDK